MKMTPSLGAPWRLATTLFVAALAGLGLPGTAAAATTTLVSQASGSCLDVPGADSTPGVALEIWSCNDGSNQQWEYTSAAELRVLGGSRCLDASGGGASAGTRIIAYTCNGGANQKWTLTGGGQITSNLSGMCLDVTGGATANGTGVELWSCNGGRNQVWTKGSGGGSCGGSDWQRGVIYHLGDVVRYPGNGTYYKLVDVGSNGSDGTDPTISTWYWQPTSCGGGGGGGFVVTEAQFNQMFPNRNGLYTYAGLVNAIGAYPAFASTGGDTTQKQEAAAFLANVAHESDALRATREYNTANWPLYCDTSNGNTCAPGQQYYGRGPMQLSWNYNYRAAGQALGIDLWSNPDLVATDPTIAWKTAVWYWMTGTGNAGITPHDAMVNGQGFGTTIRAINGSLECNGGRPDQVQTRVNFYTNFSGVIGVSPGANLYC